jgi:hypothetical protein
MKALKRLLYVVQFLFFICFVCLPPLWLILGFPYWVLSGKDLWDDWWNFNGY